MRNVCDHRITPLKNDHLEKYIGTVDVLDMVAVLLAAYNNDPEQYRNMEDEKANRLFLDRRVIDALSKLYQ